MSNSQTTRPYEVDVRVAIAGTVTVWAESRRAALRIARELGIERLARSCTPKTQKAKAVRARKT